MIEQLLIIAAVTLFGLQHSGMSALGVKERIIDRWGKQGYSRIFNITSAVTLFLAFLSMNYWEWFYFIITPELVNLYMFATGILLVVLGLVVATRASSVISVSTVADMRTDRRPELVTDGIYSQVRHPLYLATLLMLIGMMLIYPFLNIVVFSLSLIVYVQIGAYLEEKKLVHHYGDDYLDYRKQAGFMLPKRG
ncbi:MAG: methyltransferase family protein [Candidatus Hodarchaeota archaeon]